ncbi:SPOR domain-containing protein [Novosphingobium beihaiensis]|uniref:SPOR domain-containing protein n=1 Tax=Novosphingobium beihaiensis TaxID=2930389 RepID=A0ABT0BT05_9SPHN|nr:SPOR domain-containing protein [Novosphingobium beihaiensis]MCJ2187799.1 SPOR domain-containing protein [Novosphingobium beihaiensis]
MAISDMGREDLNGDPNSGGQEGTGERPFDAPASETPAAPGADFEQPPQLELGDDDVRLPWLEGDDEEFEDEGGSGIGQGLMLAVLGLVAIGLIVGGLFWVMRDKPDQPLVADGGVIAAPKEPYKTKPENPGGEVVAGTGDTSFAVAEGQTRPPQIEDKEEPAKPGFESVGKTDNSKPAAKPSTASAPAGVGVQVGAYSTKKTAEAGWLALKSQYPALADVPHRVLQGQADIGTVYRLQAVPGDLAAAKALCSGMKDAGLSCQVKR